MNIYLLTQRTNNDYDTYDSCVVVAKTAKKAKEIYPSGNYDKPDLYCNKDNKQVWNRWQERHGSWADTPDQVTAT